MNNPKRKKVEFNLLNYESKPLAIYQFYGNTKKIAFLPFILSVSKVEALDRLDEIDNECSHLNVIVLKNKIVFNNQLNEELWSIEANPYDLDNNLPVQFISFITAEKEGLNLNYIEDHKNNITIFKDSNF